MARLPIPGQDENTWGDILNDYLSVAHEPDGELKRNADITDAQTKANSAVQTVNGQSGPTVTITAGDLGALSQADAEELFVSQGSQVVSVKDSDYGAVGDGTTDDTTAIQAAIDAAPNGATIYFPPGTYAITSEIRLKPTLAYVGAGHALSESATILQANGANITGPGDVTGLFVPEGWFNNTGFSGEPVRIHNLAFNGNRANNGSSNACGIVLTNYFSWITDCIFYNAPVDGVHLTDVTRNGSNVISNSASENRINRCRILNPGRHGVRQVCQNNISNLDGYLVDTIIAQTGQDGINMDRSAGWVIRRSHLYEIERHGIFVTNGFSTLIEGNYIEVFGEEAANGAFYAGISLTQLGHHGSQIIGNMVSCEEPSEDAGGYQYISVTASSGETDTQVVVADNIMKGPPSSPTTKGIGLVLTGNVAGSVLHARADGNRITGMNSRSFFDAGVQVYAQDSRANEHVISGDAGIGTFNGPGQGSGSAGSTVSGNDFFGTFQFGTGTGATADAVGGINNFSQPFDSMTVTLTPGNAATAALQPYVVSTFNSGFAIGVAVAPDDSQPIDTYVIHYHVRG